MPNWSEVIEEIQQELHRQPEMSDLPEDAAVAASIQKVKQKYLKELHECTGRNVISYYSGWLNTDISSNQLSINDDDMNGFMLCVHKLECSKGLDLILHTPGGGIDAAKSIVVYLKKMFDGDIRVVVPQLAMSAGTIIACSCKSIVMGKQSSLGPIDPQMNGLPTQLVRQEINKAIQEIKDDPAAVHVWRPIFEKIHPTFITMCELAGKDSVDFLKNQLCVGMFADKNDREALAKTVAENLSSAVYHKSHARHIDADECKGLGLVVEDLEDNQAIQDAILTAHHCGMHLFANTSIIKVIENHLGAMSARHVPSRT